jgi:hypothetical protein
MTWPAPGALLDALEYRLRYEDENGRATRLAAASVIAAYRELVLATQKKRNLVCSTLLQSYRDPLLGVPGAA